MKRATTIAVTVTVAALAVGVGLWTSLRAAPAAVDSPAAASAGATEMFYRQTLDDASGVPRAMSAYRGQPVVINFWATWCAPCVKEIPAFSKVHAGSNVAFVGLGIDNPAAIKVFDARVKPSYPLLAAGASGSDLARALGNEGGALPFTVVLDGTGRVVASHLGPVDEAMLRQWLAMVAPPTRRS